MLAKDEYAAKCAKVRLLADVGHTTAEIAEKLGIPERTVRRCKTTHTKAPSAATAPPEPIDPLKVAEERRARAREMSREREQLEAVAGE